MFATFATQDVTLWDALAPELGQLRDRFFIQGANLGDPSEVEGGQGGYLNPASAQMWPVGAP